MTGPIHSSFQAWGLSKLQITVTPCPRWAAFQSPRSYETIRSGKSNLFGLTTDPAGDILRLLQRRLKMGSAASWAPGIEVLKLKHSRTSNVSGISVIS